MNGCTFACVCLRNCQLYMQDSSPHHIKGKVSVCVTRFSSPLLTFSDYVCRFFSLDLSLVLTPTFALGSGLISSPLTHSCSLPASHCPCKAPLFGAQSERVSVLSLASLWLPSARMWRPSTSAAHRAEPSTVLSTLLARSAPPCHVAPQPAVSYLGVFAHIVLFAPKAHPPHPRSSAFCPAQILLKSQLWGQVLRIPLPSPQPPAAGAV